MSIVASPSIDTEALDAAITELRLGDAAWAALSHVERARLLVETFSVVGGLAREWADTAARAKGLRPDEQLAGEEWLTGPYALLDATSAYAETLLDLALRGTTLSRARLGRAPGGRVAVRVLPEGIQQWALFNGFRADVWIRPGVTAEQVRSGAGLGAKRLGEAGGVALVLGAGNISAIGPLDVLTELVAHNRAAILKVNPTFSDLVPVYREALAPLIEFGVVRVVDGDGAVGAYLVEHDGIDKVHITGSGATHDLIVWGRGEEAERRRATNDPRLTKEITSELGGVAPVIIVPGKWAPADLRHQAEHVVTMRLHNSGHNCIAAQDVVLSADWPQKAAFLAELRAAFDRAPERASWYPGSDRKLAQAADAHPGAERRHGTMLVEVAADGADELCTTEYFAPVLGVSELPGLGAEFFRAAVAFSNDKLFGTLGANVIVRPADRRAMGAAFDEALVDLRYGTIAINAWTGVGFLQARGVWGGYPGHTLDEVGSGIGVVHNAHLLADTERMIVTGPFRRFPRSILHGERSLFPRPPWFVQSRSALETAKRLTAYAAKPGWGRLLATFVAAFRA